MYIFFKKEVECYNGMYNILVFIIGTDCFFLYYTKHTKRIVII
jgi:hypothetical protein